MRRSLVRLGMLVLACVSVCFEASAELRQLDLPPLMMKRLKDGRKLKGEIKDLTPRSIVTTVLHETGSVLGSATRICVQEEWAGWAGVKPDHHYYLTSAHVVDRGTSFALGTGTRVKVEFLDSRMDLALLSAKPLSREEQLPCLPLAYSYLIGQGFDSEAAANQSFGIIGPEAAQQNLTRIDLEAFSIRTSKLERRSVETIVVASLDNGFAGREGAGPLLLFNAFGLRGMSGGAVSSTRDMNNALEDAAIGPTLYPPAAEELIGLITVVDEDGRRMAAIPAPLIFQRLCAFFSDPKRYGSVLRERSMPGGTELLDIKAYHYRSANRTSAGTGRLGDGGTGRLGDGGTGRLGDGGTGRLGDGGTGRLGDGGFRNKSSRPNWSSGIVFQDDADQRRWLSFGEEWSELSPLPESVRVTIKKSANRRGLYETPAGELRASDKDTPFPALLRLPDLAREQDALGVDISASEKSRLIMSGRPVPPCSLTLGMIGTADTVFHGVTVGVCEAVSSAKTPGEPPHKTFAIVVFPSEAAPGFAIRIDIRKVCAGENSECKVEVRSKSFENVVSEREWHAAQSPLKYLKDIVKGLARKDGRDLKRDGLRRYTNESIQLELETNGGYRLSLRAAGGALIEVHGPSSALLSPAKPELSSPDEARDLLKRLTGI